MQVCWSAFVQLVHAAAAVTPFCPNPRPTHPIPFPTLQMTLLLYHLLIHVAHKPEYAHTSAVGYSCVLFGWMALLSSPRHPGAHDAMLGGTSWQCCFNFNSLGPHICLLLLQQAHARTLFLPRCCRWHHHAARVWAGQRAGVGHALGQPGHHLPPHPLRQVGAASSAWAVGSCDCLQTCCMSCAVCAAPLILAPPCCASSSFIGHLGGMLAGYLVALGTFQFLPTGWVLSLFGSATLGLDWAAARSRDLVPYIRLPSSIAGLGSGSSSDGDVESGGSGKVRIAANGEIVRG